MTPFRDFLNLLDSSDWFCAAILVLWPYIGFVPPSWFCAAKLVLCRQVGFVSPNWFCAAILVLCRPVAFVSSKLTPKHFLKEFPR